MVGYAALWVVVVAALVSAADYYRRFSRIPSKIESFPPAKAATVHEPASESAR